MCVCVCAYVCACELVSVCVRKILCVYLCVHERRGGGVCEEGVCVRRLNTVFKVLHTRERSFPLSKWASPAAYAKTPRLAQYTLMQTNVRTQIIDESATHARTCPTEEVKWGMMAGKHDCVYSCVQ